MNLDNIKKVLKKELPYLKKEYNVSEVGVFGSYVTGEEKKDSDIDVLIEFDGPMTLFRFVDLKFYLEDKLKNEVDLVQKKGLKKFLKDPILNQVQYINV